MTIFVTIIISIVGSVLANYIVRTFDFIRKNDRHSDKPGH